MTADTMRGSNKRYVFSTPVLSNQQKADAECLWKYGNDTLMIARLLDVHESVVVKALADIREQRIRNG